LPDNYALININKRIAECNTEQQGLIGKPEVRSLCVGRTWKESPFAAQIKKPLQINYKGFLLKINLI
jgi:hypothetical protein